MKSLKELINENLKVNEMASRLAQNSGEKMSNYLLNKQKKDTKEINNALDSILKMKNDIQDAFDTFWDLERNGIEIDVEETANKYYNKLNNRISMDINHFGPDGNHADKSALFISGEERNRNWRLYFYIDEDMDINVGCYHSGAGTFGYRSYMYEKELREGPNKYDKYDKEFYFANNTFSYPNTITTEELLDYLESLEKCLRDYLDCFFKAVDEFNKEIQ